MRRRIGSMIVVLFATLFISALAIAQGQGKAQTGGLPALRAQVADLQQQIDDIELIPGPQGEQGPPGADGADGADGSDGADGADGGDLFDHPWTQFGTDVYYDGGNVIIGGTTPADSDTKLTVRGTSSTVANNWALRAVDSAQILGTLISLSSTGGAWNLGLSGTNSGTGQAGDMFFDPNNGSFPFVIKKTGNVGIGTTNPSGKLHIKLGNAGVSPHSAADDLVLEGSAHTGISILTSGANYDARLAFGSPANNLGGEIFYSFDWANGGAMRFGSGGVSDRMVILGNGNVGIGTTSPGYKLHVNGTAYATGAAGALSDVRHKKNIQPVSDGALNIIDNLRPVTYEWKYPADSGMEGTQIGFIAQEVEEVLPEIVLTQDDEEKTKALKYNELIPVLVKAIQEVKKENEALKTENEQLRKTLATLTDRQEVIEDMLLALSTQPKEKLVKLDEVQKAVQ